MSSSAALVLRRIQTIQRADSRPIPKSRKNLVTPAKAGAHTEHGSRPSPEDENGLFRMRLTTRTHRAPCTRCSGSGNSRPRSASPRLLFLQLLDARPGAVFVLLRGTAPDPAGAFDDAVAHNRNCSL